MFNIKIRQVKIDLVEWTFYKKNLLIQQTFSSSKLICWYSKYLIEVLTVIFLRVHILSTENTKNHIVRADMSGL